MKRYFLAGRFQIKVQNTISSRFFFFLSFTTNKNILSAIVFSQLHIGSNILIIKARLKRLFLSASSQLGYLMNRIYERVRIAKCRLQLGGDKKICMNRSFIEHGLDLNPVLTFISHRWPVTRTFLSHCTIRVFIEIRAGGSMFHPEAWHECVCLEGCHQKVTTS